MSSPFSRAGTGRGSGWYGGKVCTIKVSVVGPLSCLGKVHNALCSAPLTRLQLHSDVDTDKTDKDMERSCTRDGTGSDYDGDNESDSSTVLYYDTDSDITRLNSDLQDSDVPDVDSDETRLNSDTNKGTPDTDTTPLLYRPTRKRLLHDTTVRKDLFKRVRTHKQDDAGASTESIDTPPMLRQPIHYFTHKVKCL